MNDKELLEDIQQLLREQRAALRQQQEMIEHIDRRQRWGVYTKIIYWVVIISLALGGYYYAAPYLKEIRSTFQTTMTLLTATLHK